MSKEQPTPGVIDRNDWVIGGWIVFWVLVLVAGFFGFVWACGWTLHHPYFCDEETMAVAHNSLECKSRGQRITFETARDRTWAVCRCP